MTDYIKKYIVQVGLIGVGLLAYLNSEELSPGARAFPRTMAISLLVLVLLLMLSNYIKQRRQGSTSSKENNPGAGMDMKTTIILVGFIIFNVLFVWLLPRIGFEISGFLFLCGGMAMLGGRLIKRFWWVAILLPVVLGVVFRTLLDLRLPLFPFLT